MQVDSLALRMRPRSPLQAADLGVRLCQSAARDVYRCYWLVALPVVALSLATFEIASWLPALLIWWAKPWLDRTVLFVLSRAAFGQPSSVSDLLRAQRQVWWSQLFLTLTTRRLSPWRSFTQSVYQLEGLPFLASRKRVLQIRRGRTTPANLVTFAFGTAEALLAIALVSLIFWFEPGDPIRFQAGVFADFELPATIAYALVVLFLEPFYVAAGFALYLNRRAQLEAWDIEQELRRAFQT
ncbi:MAG: hypothetical protein JSR66_21720 [Proteobacteria bacterium]|nr:hypothetical protein [Pseudomonadota bacterium]